MQKKHALQIRELLFSWRENTAAILNISELTVGQGESLFIQGPSGSGKSTLLNILSGVIAAKQGSIELLDKPFSSLSGAKRDQFRSDHIGYIFQQFNLLPYLTVIENVLLPVKISAERRNGQSKNSPELSNEAMHWLNELRVPKHLFHEKVSRLSIGQQQRVAAARAIIGSPEIIIADEPTSALDQNNIDNFMNVFVEQCKKINSSLIFVSHDLNLSQYFDNTYELTQHTQGDQL